MVQRLGGEGRAPRRSCELVGSALNLAPLQAAQRLAHMAGRPAMYVPLAGVGGRRDAGVGGSYPETSVGALTLVRYPR